MNAPSRQTYATFFPNGYFSHFPHIISHILVLQVRARVGASATLLLAFPRQGDCYVASVGAVQCVAASAMGAFASGWAQGRLLTAPHTLECVPLWLQAYLQTAFRDYTWLLFTHTSTYNTTKHAYTFTAAAFVHSSISPAARHSSNDSERRRVHRALDGAPLPPQLACLGLTRVLGMTALKPAVSAEPTVVRLPLTSDTQQLVLVSPALATLASPMQCALCLHYFIQVCFHAHSRMGLCKTPVIHDADTVLRAAGVRRRAGGRAWQPPACGKGRCRAPGGRPRRILFCHSLPGAAGRAVPGDGAACTGRAGHQGQAAVLHTKCRCVCFPFLVVAPN